jgi:hypothetical protein
MVKDSITVARDCRIDCPLARLREILGAVRSRLKKSLGRQPRTMSIRIHEKFIASIFIGIHPGNYTIDGLGGELRS